MPSSATVITSLRDWSVDTAESGTSSVGFGADAAAAAGRTGPRR